MATERACLAALPRCATDRRISFMLFNLDNMKLGSLPRKTRMTSSLVSSILLTQEPTPSWAV